MGNCSFKSVAISDAKECNIIRIMTDSGDIIEFEGPKFAGKVLGNFPGYGIFRQGRISSPLPDNEELRSGQIYFLLPLEKSKSAKNTVDSRNLNNECSSEPEEAEKVSKTGENCANANNEREREAEPEPVRMSTSVEVLPPPQKGVWKVKFLINTKQLEEILSEQVDTEALIEQMRLAASAGIVTPRRTKLNWGQWGANWKPTCSTMFKNSVDQSKIRSPESGTGSLMETKAIIGDEIIMAK